MPTPLGGGVAIWLTTVGIWGSGCWRCSPWGKADLPEPLAGMPAGSALRAGVLVWILLAGQRDHGHGPLSTIPVDLDWRVRLGIQFGCAIVLAATGVRVTLFGPFTHPLLGGAVTVLWIVGLTNAFNMLDNMDGLAASVGLIAALLFCGAQVAVGSLFVPAVLLVVVGAWRGFWCITTPRPGSSWAMRAAISSGSCSGP